VLEQHGDKDMLKHYKRPFDELLDPELEGEMDEITFMEDNNFDQNKYNG